MPQNFPKLWKKPDVQVQESQRVPKKMNLKKVYTNRCYIKMRKS